MKRPCEERLNSDPSFPLVDWLRDVSGREVLWRLLNREIEWKANKF